MSLLEPGSEVGRYKLLGRLATGGMSDIYLARQSGPSGFSKVVVLKAILPHLAADPDFMRMFTNEAKLAALLNHPNIVQIFDYGEEQGLPYMAMEYIDGRNLSRITQALAQRDEQIPRSIALRIVSDTCGALEYAHGLCDPATGAQLAIIHRDVSRENILVTYSGQVTLVDFGVAKSSFLESYTTSGTLKGKYAYMAPETILGEELDSRVDIYALGVVLYALLLNRLPFLAKNHAQLLRLILHEQPPLPRQLDPSLPKPLEEIVLKAMHKDRAQRYRRASELRRALESYLHENEAVVMPDDLAEFMAATFPTGTDKDRETYQSLTGATPLTPSQTSPSSELSPPSSSSSSKERSSSKELSPPRRLKKRSPSTDLAPSAEELSPSDEVPLRALRGADGGAPPLTVPGRPSKRWPAVAVGVGVGLVLALLASAVIFYWARRRHDDVKPVTGPSPAADAASKPPARRRADLSAARVPAVPDAKAASATGPRPGSQVGHLWVEAPAPGEVLLGKTRLGPLPLTEHAVPAGGHRLEVRSDTLKYRMTRRVVVRAGGQHKLRFAPREGTIEVTVHPRAQITVDGTVLGTTPLKPIKVLEGRHVVVIENAELGARQVKQVQVRPDQPTVLEVSLE